MVLASNNHRPLTAQLRVQDVQIAVREAGINPNYWYAVAWSESLPPGTVKGIEIWQEKIALYRGTDGTLGAIADACPHKNVELSRGKVMGAHLACRYHGWEFDPTGQCQHIPYLPPEQKLPCAQARAYPIRERYGLLWLFPGDPTLAEAMPLPEIPEYDDPGWFAVPVNGHFQAHFSICNENAMDVFHGFLHEDMQGWFNPQLTGLRDEGGAIAADYQVSYGGRLAKLLGFTDRASGVTTKTITVQYRYPHYHSSLEGVSSLYLMRLPVGPTESRSFAIFFLKLALPTWITVPLRRLLMPLLQRQFFERFLVQDQEMMESEQRAYLANPQRRYVEINPAIIAVQRLIVRQYQQYQATLGEQSAPD
jgi:phenylpropionate dioxygenase-like ring-hydroxylating dioxygenase large terminal subunit